MEGTAGVGGALPGEEAGATRGGNGGAGVIPGTGPKRFGGEKENFGSATMPGTGPKRVGGENFGAGMIPVSGIGGKNDEETRTPCRFLFSSGPRRRVLVCIDK